LPVDREHTPDGRVFRFVSERRDAVDLRARLRAALDANERVFFMANPESGEFVLGVGAVCEVRSDGPGRFDEAARFTKEVLSRCEPADGGAGAADAALLRFVGGFGFSDSPGDSERWSDYAPCWMFLPRELSVVAGGVEHAFRFVTEAGSSSPEHSTSVRPIDPEYGGDGADNWNERVESVLERIESGDLEKVVLSRSVAFDVPVGRDAVSILDELIEKRPSCHTFLVASGESIFFGSTPELLVRLHGRAFTTQAIAGTAPRGRDEDEDRRLGDALLASPKNRREQDAVVRGIEEAVTGAAADLCADPQPGLIRVPEAFHLHTRVTGTWIEGEGALEAAGRLHPTPAVCGTPARAAARVIEAEEDRGWYSGAVGWSDGDGDGVFVVALRAGLIRRGLVTLWAGAGIVAGSEAEAERLETEVKLRALGDVLCSGPDETAGGDEFEVAS
jgi:isochorismate synthase